MTKMKHKDARKLMKRNEFVELIKGSREYIEKHTENVVIYAVIAVIVIVAIPLFLNYKKGNELKAEELLSRGNYYVNRPVMEDENATMYGMFQSKEAKYEQAQTVYMEILQKYKGTKAAASAYLGVANSYFSLGQFNEAIGYYDSFLENFPKNMLLPDALNGKAYSLYELGKFQEAADIWSMDDNFKGKANYYDAKLKLAECYVQLKQSEKAKAIFEEIIKEKPDSYWSDAAMEKSKGL